MKKMRFSPVSEMAHHLVGQFDDNRLERLLQAARVRRGARGLPAEVWAGRPSDLNSLGRAMAISAFAKMQGGLDDRAARFELPTGDVRWLLDTSYPGQEWPRARLTAASAVAIEQAKLTGLLTPADIPMSATDPAGRWQGTRWVATDEVAMPLETPSVVLRLNGAYQVYARQFCQDARVGVEAARRRFPKFGKYVLAALLAAGAEIGLRLPPEQYPDWHRQSVERIKRSIIEQLIRFFAWEVQAEISWEMVEGGLDRLEKELSEH